MSEATDEFLISRIVVFNDHKSFKILLERYHGPMRNLLMKLTNFDEEMTNDLLQEVGIRIYTGLKSFKGKSSLNSWIYRIAYNVFISEHSKRQRRGNQIEVLSKSVDVTSITQSEQNIDLNILISFLKPEEKLAIQMSYIEGYSHKEIAEILQCPLGTVKSHIKRGKERIRRQLKK